MTDAAVPTRAAWGNLDVDSDVEYGYDLFGGKTVQEAMPLFVGNPMERSAELRFTTPAVFNYYVFCFVEHLMSPDSAGESDMASCFLRLVRGRAIEQPATLALVWQRLRQAVIFVAERQSFYDADVDIYGRFDELRQEIEHAMEAFAAGA